jgi:hypothetical protein
MRGNAERKKTAPPENNNICWTDETEESVRLFLEMDTQFLTRCLKGSLASYQKKIEWSMSEEVQDKKNRLYKNQLEKPLNQMIENIFYRYMLSDYGIDIITAHNDCLSYVYEKFTNFNPYIGYKSYSYYSTIIKSYVMNEIYKIKKNKKYNDR